MVSAKNGLVLKIIGDDYWDCPEYWTYDGAIYFCFTIVTTIGYGDTAPQTDDGKVFFLFYVIPGMIICGAVIGEIGRLMSLALNWGKVCLNILNGILLTLEGIGSGWVPGG